MKGTVLTEKEIQDLLGSIDNRLESQEMRSNNIIGRTITVVNGEKSKQSGGIMISKSDDSFSDYLGIYYNLEDFLKALNEYISQPKEISGTFQRKGKIELEQKVVNEALKEFTSLYLQKLVREVGADFYVVSRSDSGENEVRRTGGIITPRDMPVKEGQYIDETTARTIAAGVGMSAVIDDPIIGGVPTGGFFEEQPVDKDLVEEIARKIFEQEKQESTFRKRILLGELKKKISELTRRTVPFLLIPIISFSVNKLMSEYQAPINDPVVPGLEQDISDETLTDEGISLPSKVVIDGDTADSLDFEVEDLSQTEIEDVNHSLEIGDIVAMNDGDRYDLTAQAQDGVSGEIGSNPYREEGDYTVDVIAIIDSDTGNIIATTSEKGGNLEDLLLSNGYSHDDIESGKVQVRYNVSEGKNADLDRTNAAGWVSYDKDSYQSKENIINDMLKEQVNNNCQGGKGI